MYQINNYLVAQKGWIKSFIQNPEYNYDWFFQVIFMF